MTTNEGLHPDAHPTAPGGMSQRALAEELVERHGYTKQMIRDLWREGKAWRVGSWPEMIDAVCQERRTREWEAGATSSTGIEVTDSFGTREVEYEMDPVAAAEQEASAVSTPDDEVTDIEAELAEIAEAQAEAASEALFIGMPRTRDFIFDGHAGAGPSGAERWMNCTASLGMARKFLETLTPNQQREFAGGSAAARQGTTAHAAGEAEIRLLLGEIDADERDSLLMHLTVMPESEHEAYDEEMAEYVSEYVDLINTYIDERGEDHVMVEQRLEAGIPLPQPLSNGDDVHVLAGSGDAVIMPTKTEPDLVVADYKHGNGIDVDVDSNPQVRIYGLGALALLIDEEGNLITDVQTITYHIVQPRLGGIKTWTETLDELLDWRDEVLAPALYAALTGEGAVFAPSESTCQWCPARGTCPALAEQRVEEGADLFDTIVEAEFENGAGSFPETDTLDNTRLGSLLSQIEGLVAIKDDLRAEAQRRLHRGEEVPGYKLVGYTPPKKWVEDASEELDPAAWAPDERARIKQLWVKKLLTPKQAYTLLKKSGAEDIEAMLGEYHDHPVQKPVIARVDDRRHEWKGAPPEQMFTDLDAEK